MAAICALCPPGQPLLHTAVASGSAELLAVLGEWARTKGARWAVAEPGAGGVTPLHLSALLRHPALLTAVFGEPRCARCAGLPCCARCACCAAQRACGSPSALAPGVDLQQRWHLLSQCRRAQTAWPLEPLHLLFQVAPISAPLSLPCPADLDPATARTAWSGAAAQDGCTPAQYAALSKAALTQQAQQGAAAQQAQQQYSQLLEAVQGLAMSSQVAGAHPSAHPPALPTVAEDRATDGGMAAGPAGVPERAGGSAHAGSAFAPYAMVAERAGSLPALPPLGMARAGRTGSGASAVSSDRASSSRLPDSPAAAALAQQRASSSRLPDSPAIAQRGGGAERASSSRLDALVEAAEHMSIKEGAGGKQQQQQLVQEFEDDVPLKPHARRAGPPGSGRGVLGGGTPGSAAPAWVTAHWRGGEEEGETLGQLAVGLDSEEERQLDLLQHQF